MCDWYSRQCLLKENKGNMRHGQIIAYTFVVVVEVFIKKSVTTYVWLYNQ